MTRQELAFIVHGLPATQGSKRYLGNGRFIEASKDLKPWRAAIADAVFRKMIMTADERQFTEPVVIQVTFYLPKPKTVERLWPSGLRDKDLDKLQRALGDGLSVDSQVLADDSLVVKWEAKKVWAPTPEDMGAKVYIRLATDEDMKDYKFITFA